MGRAKTKLILNESNLVEFELNLVKRCTNNFNVG
jgi:hypothetical protein